MMQSRVRAVCKATFQIIYVVYDQVHGYHLLHLKLVYEQRMFVYFHVFIGCHIKVALCILNNRANIRTDIQSVCTWTLHR